MFRKNHYSSDPQLISDIRKYIDENYVSAPAFVFGTQIQTDAHPKAAASAPMPSCSIPFEDRADFEGKADLLEDTADLSEVLRDLDESFSEMLLRMIDERGMKDSECYKKAGIDRKLFSKIRSNPMYRPSKTTAISFAIALELSLDETEDLLMKAGFALSHSSKSDVIIEYFIKLRIYDLHTINSALYEFDQPLLGS